MADAASDGMVIVCADVGSVARKNFGWWSEAGGSGSLPSALAEHVAGLLNSGRRVALGFECPLFVPLAEDQLALTRARPGEGSRAWSAGAGCGALAVGLVEVVWVLKAIRAHLARDVAAYLSWDEFAALQGTPSLLLWEAFVSGSAKLPSHVEDAQVGAYALARSRDDPSKANAVACDGEIHSLIGAALLRTGWRSDVDVLQEPCLVMRA